MGRECFDEDECLLRTHGCSQNCVNTKGSFICVCFKGFEKDLSTSDDCTGIFSDCSLYFSIILLITIINNLLRL